MVQHLTNVPASESLIRSLADIRAVAPATPSDAPAALQHDTKLPSSLTALAVPLAAAVARLEAVTRDEVEQDTWLHDSLVNFTVIAQKFVDASRVLTVAPGRDTGEACSREASATAADVEAAGASSDGGPTADEAASATADDPADVQVEDACGSASVDLRQARQSHTVSTGSAYGSSAAGSSDGSVAAGSVSVNHAGINGVESSSVSSGNGRKSEQGGLLRDESVQDSEVDKAGTVTVAEEPVGEGHSLPCLMRKGVCGRSLQARLRCMH